MNDILENLQWRYAVKKFDTNKVLPEKKIERLTMAFNLTATSYGLQPIKMVVVRDKELQDQLVPYSFNQQQVAQASHVLVLCIENTISREYIVSYFERVQQVRGTSDEILQPFREGLIDEFSQKSVDEIRAWATNQAYLAMGNLLTICAAEKIDACPMEGFVPKGYDEILNLSDKGLKSVLVMPVGYRAEDDIFADFKKVRRKLTDSIIRIS